MSRRNATSAGVNAIVALLLLCGFIAMAHAAEPPDNVEAEVADAVQSCKDLEGKPNADAVLKVEDVNGDGGEDWIVDYSKLKCDGGINQMCERRRLHLADLPVERRRGLEPRLRRDGEELQIHEARRQAPDAGGDGGIGLRQAEQRHLPCDLSAL